MAKLTRKNLLLFCSGASSGKIEQFGSRAANSRLPATDPEIIQALAGFLLGWDGALIIDGTSTVPTKEDMNALFYLLNYHISYLLQQGIPEWNKDTTYYTNSICQISGTVYISLIDTNLNNNPSSTLDTDWAIQSDPVYHYFNDASTKARSFRKYSSGGFIITEKWNGSGWDFISSEG